MITKNNMRNSLTVKRITGETDLQAALKLAENVFMQFEAPTFSKRGVESFLSFIWGERVREMFGDGSFTVWGCCGGDELVGILPCGTASISALRLSARIFTAGG